MNFYDSMDCLKSYDTCLETFKTPLIQRKCKKKKKKKKYWNTLNIKQRLRWQQKVIYCISEVTERNRVCGCSWSKGLKKKEQIAD